MGKPHIPSVLRHLFLLIYSVWINYLLLSSLLIWEIKADAETFKTPLKTSVVLRNFSQDLTGSASSTIQKVPFRGNSRPLNKNEFINLNYESTNDSRVNNSSVDNIKVVELTPSSRPSEETTLKPPSRIVGVDTGTSKDPAELIRNVLINHTMEHGGEQDLDKLVFSALPQGKKLVFRTVRIIRTDENGDPIDEAEDSQPTYWDVTLANATSKGEDGGEDESNDASSEVDDENEEEDDELSTTSESKSNDEAVKLSGKKRPDLEISGSHAAANYHHLNNFGSSDREKEIGRTNYHGNNHGKTHKHTYTVTDGKDVKPYHGAEKGLADYANDHGGSHKDQGERYNSSKRKNKRRKVTGFKRVYHKEEFQKTIHFQDDEEALEALNKFGVSDAKGASAHGTKDDKRKYQGVRTDYLDGKKHENEHGTHNGYNKGQHTSYKDTEKHSHHNNYGKSTSHHAGGSPQYHHKDSVYHPNHNYHASHSTPMNNTVLHSVSTADDDSEANRSRGRGSSRSIPAIYAAPMTTSFTVTEYVPIQDDEDFSTTPDPHFAPNRANTVRSIPAPNFQNDFNTTENYEDRMPTRRRPRKRKEPRANKVFYSPKHRPIKEGEEPTTNRNPNHLKNFSSLPKETAPYPTSSSIRGMSDGTEDLEVSSPYAPNFGPPRKPPKSNTVINNNGRLTPSHGPRPNFRRFPGPWLWSRHRPKRPRPESVAHDQTQPLPTMTSGLPLSPATAAYPILNHLSHLAAIPLRHANAYNKLANRGKYQNYFYQQQPGQINYYELSTRKSDIAEEDQPRDGNQQDSDRENDSAHYFNHNHRYAKNHLTSTIQPPPSTSSPGVRNTLIDPVPGVYSTMIKVLPATMLKVNESTSQSNLNEFRTATTKHSLITPGSLIATTRRPLTAAESISFTTQYPHPPIRHHHIPQHTNLQHQEIRPFLPRNKWLTFTLNLGNPDYKLGHEFGPSQHPFGQNSKRVSQIMQGIKHGLMRPFGKIPIMAQPTNAMALPALIHPGHPPPHIMHHKIPLNNIPPYNHHHHQQHHHHPHAHPHVFVPHRHPPHFNRVPHQMPHQGIQPGMLPLSTKAHALTLSAPTSQAPPSGLTENRRPKFYYDYKPNNNKTENKTVSESSSINSNNAYEPNRKGLYKPTLKVSASPKSSSTLPDSTTADPPKTNTFSTDKSDRRRGTYIASQTQPPPFINGIMDSVAGFFGQVA